MNSDGNGQTVSCDWTGFMIPCECQYYCICQLVAWLRTQALHWTQDFELLQDQCAFNGAWGGGSRHPTAFYVSSYFWDRATDAGIITDENALTWDLKPADMIAAANKACDSPVSGLSAVFPNVSQAPVSAQKSDLARGDRLVACIWLTGRLLQ